MDDLRDPLYRRIVLPSGRVRYRACATRQVLDALPQGDYLLRVTPGGKELVRVEPLAPDDARVTAALLAFKEDLRAALRESTRAEPGYSGRPATDLELRGHAAYRAVVGDYPICWRYPSLQQAVDTAVDTWFARVNADAAPDGA